MDCIYELNPMSGGVGSHNGRCARGVESAEIHLAPTHHVRLNGWCGRVCAQCVDELSHRRDFKEAKVREL